MRDKIAGLSVRSRIRATAYMDDTLPAIHLGVVQFAAYRVILVPTPEAQQATTGLQDFRIGLAQHIPAGTNIYTVLALDEQAEVDLGGVALEGMIPHARQIGVLTTGQALSASTGPGPEPVLLISKKWFERWIMPHDDIGHASAVDPFQP
jgi:hypothetical protein